MSSTWCWPGCLAGSCCAIPTAIGSFPAADLNPGTRLAAAAAAAALALLLPGWSCALPLLATLLAAACARRLREMGVVAAALTPVIAASIAVNALLPAGGSRGAGVLAALRILGMALPPALLLRTTRLSRLTADLERRGLPPGAAFVVIAGVAALPDLRNRVLRVAEARAARGLDAAGSLPARIRRVAALVRPVIIGTLDDAEARALALEVRGFRRARHRTVVAPPPDSRAQAALRVLLAVAVGAGVAIRLLWR